MYPYAVDALRVEVDERRRIKRGGNVLAYEIGLIDLARLPAAITRMLREGPVATVGCAEANGEPFLLMMGAGFDAPIRRRPRVDPELGDPPRE